MDTNNLSKNDNGGSSIGLIFALIVVVAVVLIFVFDVFDIRKTQYLPELDNSTSVTPDKKTDDKQDNKQEEKKENPEIIEQKVLTDEEITARNEVILEYLLDFLNKKITGDQFRKAGIVNPNCEGYESEVCNVDFNFEVADYDSKKCNSLYKKYDFITVTKCEDYYMSAKKIINIKFENGVFLITN